LKKVAKEIVNELEEICGDEEFDSIGEGE